MALTQTELQSVVNAVLSSIRTNSRTIDQLTTVNSLSETDCFEIGGGKKVKYSTLRDLIASASATTQDNLLTLVNKCELVSAHFEATDSTATLVVSSKGKTITCSVPIASTNGSGFMTATDKIKLQSAYDIAQMAKDIAQSGKTTAENAMSGVTAINDMVGASNGIAPLDSNGFVPASHLPGYVDDVVEFNAMVDNVTIQNVGSIRKSTDNGCMVVYDKTRNRFLLAVSRRTEDVSNKGWGAIIRPVGLAKFPMGQLNPTTPEAQDLAVTSTDLPTRETEISGGVTANEVLDKYWGVDNGNIALQTSQFDFYTLWVDAMVYGEDDGVNGRTPNTGKIYTCTSDNKTFRWSGTALVAIGSDLALGHTSSTAYPGDEGDALKTRVDSYEEQLYTAQGDIETLQGDVETANGYIENLTSKQTQAEQKINGIAILPFNGQYDPSSGKTRPTRGVYLVKSSTDGDRFHIYDKVSVYSLSDYNKFDVDGNFEGIRTDCIFRHNATLYRWNEQKQRLMEVGGASVGNTLNLTAEQPTSEPSKVFYQLSNPDDTYYAPAVVLSAGHAKFGLQITFAISKTGWKTYQYIGTDLNDTSVLNKDNWLDLAGMSAGGESIINVNHLCGDKDRTLATAIEDVLNIERSSGIKHLKQGLVLTYRTAKKDVKGNPVWESYQYTRLPQDVNSGDDTPWIPFGSGGSKVETKSDPQAGGTDAFSTGGAYKHLPTKNVVTQAEGTVTIQMLNDAEEAVGDPITFFASQGGGMASGTIVSIVFEKSPLYGAVGRNIVGKACIRSITMSGGSEQANGITNIRIIDRDTKAVVKEWKLNQRSSDIDEYNYDIPFTGLLTGAGKKNYVVEVTDDTDTVGTRGISVTAVDATAESCQVLHYTADYTLPFNGTKGVKIPMFKFPRNVSEKGIHAFVDIWWDGAWRPLTSAPSLHLDSYANSIEINPSNVFGGGEKMNHGAYPVRIKGRDVASGVEGNTLYTAVMCIDPTNTTPCVALRYNDTKGGKVKLYERVAVEVAAYTPGKLTTHVEVKADDTLISRIECAQNITHTAEMQVTGHATDGTENINIKVRAYDGDTTLAESGTVRINVFDSVINAKLMIGSLYHFDFSGRSNAEPDHSIKHGDFAIDIKGANWSSNGFCNYLGQNALRIAENVTASLNHMPFASRNIEATGMAFQMMFATNNIKTSEALLLECFDPDAGAGFYIKGNKVGLVCKSGSPQKIERRFPCGEIHTMAVTVEPATFSINRNGTEWATMRLYIDGECVGAIGYNPGGGRLLNERNITMNGKEGDLYVYYMIGYQTHFDWSQGFKNYVVKLPDTDKMLTEFNFEDVLASQTAEGVTGMSPQAAKLWERGMPYLIEVHDEEQFEIYDKGKGGDDIGTSTSDKFILRKLYYYDPIRPWRSFVAYNVEKRRQGTTSAKRCKKNNRYYLSKCLRIDPLFPNYTNEDALITYKLFALKLVRVGENTIPVGLITVKIDFSNSSGANDCSVCDMINATYRALGPDYLTPAQRCYDGTFKEGDVSLTGLEMNHSTANHPIAVYRSTSDTLQNVYFEAKGNWKEDKSEQVALGFKDTPGYNKGCLNYQDGTFIEIIGTVGETLDMLEARFKTMEKLDTTKCYLLSLYCGRNYRFMRYQNGTWINTTGSWRWVNNKPVITGDVLNPVGGFELLTYEGMDWWKGVSSVEDMMRPSSNVASWIQKLINDKPKLGVTGTQFPAWTYYFECMVDSDQLAADFAMGRKVPFELYVRLRHCDHCDYDKHEDWVTRWENSAWMFRNVKADMVYLADADYQNQFDSLSKNHQPMHFLREGCDVVGGVYCPDRAGATDPDGFNCEFVLVEQPTVQQANKKYDVDGAYQSDNDGGDTGQPEADPTKPSDTATGYVNPWAGWGAIPWRAYFASGKIKLDAAGTEVEYQKTVVAMRNVQITLTDGRKLNPFSPDGAKYYFIEKRLRRWPKVVSSYDGIRKYIKYTATSDALYFYALQGLGLSALPQFIEQRWRFRDGYYKTGGFFTGVLSGRIACAEDAQIRIVAAKSGYFGMGNDSSGSLSADGAVYLEEGQEYIFRNFSKQQGALLYIYQADRMRDVEFTGVSLSENFDFSVMKLAERIIIGGEAYVQHTIGYNPLTVLPLSELPFLRELDVRNTPVSSIEASKCPRLERLLASGSQLATVKVAETAPIELLELPDTITELHLNNLPKLSYPGGLKLMSMANVNRVMLGGCPNIDPQKLLMEVMKGTKLKYLRLPEVNVLAKSEMLASLMTRGIIGLAPNGEAYESNGTCLGVTGRWICTDYIPEDGNAAITLAKLQAYFPMLEVHNSQFSQITYSDDVDDCENITNVDDSTGWKFETPYTVPAHWRKLEAMSHTYKSVYDQANEVMRCVQLADDTYLKLANGTAFDPGDMAGEGFDVMKHIPVFYKKGVNDFKNQEKHTFLSAKQTEPISTCATNPDGSLRINRKRLADILVRESSALLMNQNNVGEEPVLTLNGNFNSYELEVEGMKQVRWPGVNIGNIGVVFIGADGKVMHKWNMLVTHAQFDFTPGNYIFIDVPAGAKKFIFSTQKGFDMEEAIAVDSTSVEAIEPDWVRHEEELVAVYGGVLDSLGNLRSISNKTTRRGNDYSATNTEWSYDAEGNLRNTSIPTSQINYTGADMINLCRLRGKGFYAQDYESHNDLATIIYGLLGNRNVQAVCGYGCRPYYVTGAGDTYGNVTLKSASSGDRGNILFGLQNYIACEWESMDNVGINVLDFLSWRKNKYGGGIGEKVDGKWHIYNVNTKTERVVQGITDSGYCIARVVHGRHCDIIPSRRSEDRSQWNRNYADMYEYSHSASRLPRRAGYSANAYGGLAYVYANSDASYASTNIGVRLAFRGAIVFEET